MIKYKGMLPKPSTSDSVILVDYLDRKIGEMDKLDAHRGEGKRHRAISVFLFNSKGELLIQQRSDKKIVGALQWANTCCGNVRPNETRRACSIRRLKEELGIERVAIKPLFRFEYKAKCNNEFSEWEIDEVYVGEFEGSCHINVEEVSKVCWKRPNEILKELDNISERKKYAPWFITIMSLGFF